ncbi:MAG: hypothetical protein MJ162_06470 [Treponema sp.]|nr:hypothetical protein [Treponema sp.]
MILRNSGKKLVLICTQLLLSFFIFAQGYLTNAILRELRVAPETEQQFYTNTDVKFQVIIPYVNPSQVDVSAPEQSDIVTFQSMRRSAVAATENSPLGTKIELVFRFSKKGTYKLPSLVVRIRNIPRQIQFKEISVNINPMEQLPLMIVEFEDGTQVSSEFDSPKQPVINTPAGKKLKLKIYLQYGMQLIQFNHSLPVDSIFTQTATYEITELKYREKIFSEQLVPVADYEWTPLSKGKIAFPKFGFTVIAYNGNKYDLFMPIFTINVEDPVAAEEDSSGIEFFTAAFDFSSEQEKGQEIKVVSEEECKKLVELRSAERHGVWFSAASKRKAFERELGLPDKQGEFPVIIFYLSVVFVVLSAVIFCIFIKRKKHTGSVFVAVLFICSLSLLIFSWARKSVVYAVTLDTALCSIPEDIAEAKSKLVAGSRVKVTEQTDKWVYVKTGDIAGWCPKEKVLIIR